MVATTLPSTKGVPINHKHQPRNCAADAQIVPRRPMRKAKKAIATAVTAAARSYDATIIGIVYVAVGLPIAWRCLTTALELARDGLTIEKWWMQKDTAEHAGVVLCHQLQSTHA